MQSPSQPQRVAAKYPRERENYDNIRLEILLAQILLDPDCWHFSLSFEPIWWTGVNSSIISALAVTRSWIRPTLSNRVHGLPVCPNLCYGEDRLSRGALNSPVQNFPQPRKPPVLGDGRKNRVPQATLQL